MDPRRPPRPRPSAPPDANAGFVAEPPPPTVVVAMGGHAFVREGQTPDDDAHTENARIVCAELMTFIDRGYNVVITHGNGPQVGYMLERAEATADRLPRKPLDVLVAQTEGMLGYYLQRAMLNELRGRAMERYVVTMVTQVLVDPDDPALLSPTKPVGPFYAKEEAESFQRDHGWAVIDDGRRGWRRVVPSPRPQQILQAGIVVDAMRSGNIVIAGGGGGIPVTIARDGSNDLVGIEAVIDKDLTSGVMATDVGADLLVILTAVDAVYVGWDTPEQQRLGAVTMAECERYIRDGQFPIGSMGPKVEAIHGFLQRGGRRGLITDPANLRDALDGKAGTHFIGRI
ncbi:MAG: carbamate kinase [Myxococcota bacterium]